MADKNPMEMTSAETDEFFEAATEGIKTAEAAIDQHEPTEEIVTDSAAESDSQEASDSTSAQSSETVVARARTLDELIESRKAEEAKDPSGALRAQYVFMECLPNLDWDAIYKWQCFLKPLRDGQSNNPYEFMRTYKPHHEFPPEEGRIRADTVLGEHRDLAVEEAHIDERSRIVHLANERQLFWNVRAYVFELGRIVKLKGLSPLAPTSILLDPVPDAEGEPTKAPYLPSTMNLREAYGTLGMPLEQPLGFLVKTSADGYWPLERVFVIGGEFESQRPVAKEMPKEPAPATSEKPVPNTSESQQPGPSGLVPAEMPAHLRRLRDLDELYARDAPRREEARRQDRYDQRKPYGQRPRQRPAYRDYNGSHSSHGRVSKPEGPFKGPHGSRTFTNSSRKQFSRSDASSYSRSSQSGSENVTQQMQQLSLPTPMQQIPPSMHQMPVQWSAPQMMPMNAGMQMMSGFGMQPMPHAPRMPFMPMQHDPSRVFVCPVCHQVHLHPHTAYEPCTCHPMQRH
ncbi:hypothetical protein AAVH_11972 [Aphelenchoides avenae]|nr:hypothetical protein AAVH_11972 [Aphelenchus avenae]